MKGDGFVSNRNDDILKWIAAGYFGLIIFCTLYITGFISNRLNNGPKSIGIMDNIFSFLLIGFHIEIFLPVLFGFTVLSYIFIKLLSNSNNSNLGYHIIKKLLNWDKNGKDELGRSIPKAEGDQLFGEGHLAQPEEYENIAVVQPVEEAWGDILGLYEHAKNGEKRVVNLRMDAREEGIHSLVLAPTRGGKTAKYAQNKLFQANKRQEINIVNDQKGELSEMNAIYEKIHCIPRYVLNLDDPRKSDGFNIFSLINNETAVKDCRLIATTWLTNAALDGTSQAYILNGISLFQALLLRVFDGTDFADDSIPDEYVLKNFFSQPNKAEYKVLPGRYIGRKNIGTVYDMLLCAGITTNEKSLKLDKLAELETYFTPEVLEASGSQRANKPFQTFLIQNKEFRPGVMGTLATGLDVLQDENIRRVLCTNGINLSKIGERRCNYYCVTPGLNKMYQSIVSLFFKMASEELMKYAKKQPDGKLPIPANFLLDEFANIGVLPEWDGVVSLVAGLNISINMIVQDLSQLKNKYPKEFESFIANCGILLVLGVNDNYTASYLEKRSGMLTTKIISHHYSSKNLQQSSTAAVGKRETLDASDFFFKDKNLSFIFFEGIHPIVVEKFPYWEHPEYEKMPKNEKGNRPLRIKNDELPDLGTPARRRMEIDMWRAADAYERIYGDPKTLDRSYEGRCIPYYKKNKKHSAGFKDYIPKNYDDYSQDSALNSKPIQIIRLEECDFEVVAGSLVSTKNDSNKATDNEKEYNKRLHESVSSRKDETLEKHLNQKEKKLFSKSNIQTEALLTLSERESISPDLSEEECDFDRLDPQSPNRREISLIDLDDDVVENDCQKPEPLLKPPNRQKE